jgi:hypothetical protein
MLRPLALCALALALSATAVACDKSGGDGTSPEPASGDAEGTAPEADGSDAEAEPEGETFTDVHLCCETRAGIDGQTLALSGCAKVEVEEAAACTDGGQFYIDCDEATCTDKSCHCNEHHDEPSDEAAEAGEAAEPAPAE